MNREKFENLVVSAIANLPPEFRSKLENVDVVVEDWPTSGQLKELKISHHGQLLGLYQGVPQIKRGRGYGMVVPDKISIFQKPIEAQCRFDEEVEAKIGEVVRHEIAHHFGIDEKTLRRIEGERRKRKR
jgi:predicted Zn-dependent protease with MMP-like domain